MIQLQALIENKNRQAKTYTITAIIDSALCVGAGGSSGSLADKPIVRNPENNLLIPGSQIKGRVRHECEKILRGLNWAISESPNAGRMVIRRDNVPDKFKRSEYEIPGYDNTYHCLISQIFGDPVLPSRVIFDDLIYTEDPENLPEIIRPGVTINRRRRTGEENKLYFLETSPANAKLKFQGKIHIQPSWKSEIPDYAKVLILIGLKQIYALGGSKSAGLGWLHWELEELENEVKNMNSTEIWELLGRGEIK